MRPDQRAPRIGVFGGTFDPVHAGHLHVANQLRKTLALDRILWIPAGRPPHKRGQIVSSDADRLAMLEFALAGSPTDEISTMEIERAGPSYTADTLEHLQRQVAPAKLVFLLGEDSLRDLPTWRDPERILRAAELGVAGRPGIEANIGDLIATLPELQGRLTIAPMDELPISSSEIRQRVASGQSIAHFVPQAVADYIAERGLYLPESRKPDGRLPSSATSRRSSGTNAP